MEPDKVSVVKRSVYQGVKRHGCSKKLENRNF